LKKYKTFARLEIGVKNQFPLGGSMGKIRWQARAQNNYRVRKGESPADWCLRVTLKHPEGDVVVFLAFRATDKDEAEDKACRLLKQFLAKWVDGGYYARLQARLAKNTNSSPVFILRFSCTYVDRVLKAKTSQEVFKQIREKKGREVINQALQPRRAAPRTLPGHTS
jgi:hypothetical protein